MKQILEIAKLAQLSNDIPRLLCRGNTDQPQYCARMSTTDVWSILSRVKRKLNKRQAVKIKILQFAAATPNKRATESSKTRCCARIPKGYSVKDCYNLSKTPGEFKPRKKTRREGATGNKDNMKK